MPAKSKKQRKIMGMAMALKEGKNLPGASPAVKKIARTMPPQALKEMATTKEKGLPMKVKKPKNVIKRNKGRLK